MHSVGMRSWLAMVLLPVVRCLACTGWNHWRGGLWFSWRNCWKARCFHVNPRTHPGQYGLEGRCCSMLSLAIFVTLMVLLRSSADLLTIFSLTRAVRFVLLRLLPWKAGLQVDILWHIASGMLLADMGRANRAGWAAQVCFASISPWFSWPMWAKWMRVIGCWLGLRL